MKTKWKKYLVALLATAVLGTSGLAQDVAKEQVVGQLEIVATFSGPMPTGVSVSNDGRIFVNFPRWGDAVDYTVAEVKNGKTWAYPDAETNRFAQADNPEQKLVSVQSVVVDPSGERLWILDTGSIQFGPVKPGGGKLIGVDLKTNRIVKKIVFPQDVALPTSYLNDVRFDLRRGVEGMAFITDSTGNGPNGIIVVDLASGKSWRRLNDHPSTKPDSLFVPVVEAEIMQVRLPGQPAMRFSIGSDGIAISPDRKTLYYCPLTSRHFYSVNIDALADRSKSDSEVAATVKDLGEKGGAGDGLESDAQGRVYLTDYEHNAIRRWSAQNGFELLAHDPRMLWPDTLSLASDGFLYFTANQVERQGAFHNGKDLRHKPYVLFRLKVDATRIH